MERNRKEEQIMKSKKHQDSSNNSINVHINVGHNENDESDNSSKIDIPISDIADKDDIKKQKVADEDRVEVQDNLVNELKKEIKSFNQKKELLISRNIDIPNNIFELPDIELNTNQDIIRFTDIIRNKILVLDGLLIKPQPIPIPKQPTFLPQTRSPFNFTPNQFGNRFGFSIPQERSQRIILEIPEKPKPISNTPGKPEPDIPTPKPQETSGDTTPPPDQIPEDPAPEPELRPDRDPTDTGLSVTELELENQRLSMAINEYNEFKIYYESNKDSFDMPVLNEIINLSNLLEPKLKKIQNDLLLTRNKNKIQDLLEKLQFDINDITTKIQSLTPAEPDKPAPRPEENPPEDIPQDPDDDFVEPDPDDIQPQPIDDDNISPEPIDPIQEDIQQNLNRQRLVQAQNRINELQNYRRQFFETNRGEISQRTYDQVTSEILNLIGDLESITPKLKENQQYDEDNFNEVINRPVIMDITDSFAAAKAIRRATSQPLIPTNDLFRSYEQLGKLTLVPSPNQPNQNKFNLALLNSGQIINDTFSVNRNGDLWRIVDANSSGQSGQIPTREPNPPAPAPLPELPPQDPMELGGDGNLFESIYNIFNP